MRQKDQDRRQMERGKTGIFLGFLCRTSIVSLVVSKRE